MQVKSKHLSVRMDRATGDLWLWNEQRHQRVANITHHVLLALCADVVAEDGSKSVSRDVRFADGTVARITAEIIDA